MASRTTLAIVFGYAAAFWCLPLLSVPDPDAGRTQVALPLPRVVAAGALLPAAALGTFGFTSLLLVSYTLALGRADDAAGAAAAARRRFLDRLANATVASATAALLAGAAAATT